ncbi:MAG: transaldolase [Candidatus Promineifilaceae bacterium]
MNPLVELQAFGQSFWYDNVRRKFLTDGAIRSLIEVDGLRGMTSNPSIFEKAIGESDDYDRQVASLAQVDNTAEEIYEALALTDIRLACDLFAELYRASEAADGYVSLEVSPHLANETGKTIAEARRLFAEVGRPNVMIKVPATAEGIPAIRQLLGEGINVNITLMFNMAHYEAVAQAYLDGLAAHVGAGGDPAGLASVASFFVSRVDSAVDKRLEALADPAAEALLGKAAIANSKLVYHRFKEIFHGDDFSALKAGGARVQRLLWASTSTKNPAYPDTMYVEELIGPETVNTMPPFTIEAFRDHGVVANTLEEDVAEAELTLENLAEVGVDLEEATGQLQLDGVRAFASSFDELIATITRKAAELGSSR